MFGELSQFFSSEVELKEKWSNPSTWADLLYALDTAGYGIEVLLSVRDVLDAENCDLLDVFEYIAYSVEPIERAKRVEERRSQIFDGLSHPQQDLVEFIISKYISQGVTELAIDKLPVLLQMKYGTAKDAVRQFGGNPTLIQQTFMNFQQGLYR